MAVEPDFKKSNKKPDAKVGYRRLQAFRSYEHFKIIISLEKMIVTLSRPFLLSIQDISINEVLFCLIKNQIRLFRLYPTFSDF